MGDGVSAGREASGEPAPMPCSFCERPSDGTQLSMSGGFNGGAVICLTCARLFVDIAAQDMGVAEEAPAVQHAGAGQDVTLTVGMLLRALEGCRESVDVPGGGPGGADSYVSVVGHDALVEALERERGTGGHGS